MLAEVDCPNVKAMFDTFHTLYRSEVPTDYVHRLGRDLTHIHLADVNREPPGSGVVDFRSLLDVLKAEGFDGYLTMEIGFNRRNVEPDYLARRAHDDICSLLA